MSRSGYGTVGLRFESVARSHPGARRPLNEDRVLNRPDLTLWAVADGMGGHQDGAAAATRLIDALAGLDQGPSGFARLADLQHQVERVNASLFADHGAVDEHATSGTTMVCLMAHEGHYACVWAGDSRAYAFADGRLSAITSDHSVVQQLVDHGLLSQDHRKSHPQSHVITRAIGANREIQLDRKFAPIGEADTFLLCSDGLYGCVDEGEIATALASHRLDAAADGLLALALQRGAPDNVSLVIIRARPGA